MRNHVGLAIALVATAVIFGSCASAPEGADKSMPGSPFSGTYTLTGSSSEKPDEKVPVEAFVIDDEGVVAGAMDGSGYSGFEGTINEAGEFQGKFLKVAGVIKGNVSSSGELTGTYDVGKYGHGTLQGTRD